MEAIQEMTIPTNKIGLLVSVARFNLMGWSHVYVYFISNMSDLTNPLRVVAQKDKPYMGNSSQRTVERYEPSPTES